VLINREPSSFFYTKAKSTRVLLGLFLCKVKYPLSATKRLLATGEKKLLYLLKIPRKQLKTSYLF